MGGTDSAFYRKLSNCKCLKGTSFLHYNLICMTLCFILFLIYVVWRKHVLFNKSLMFIITNDLHCLYNYKGW